MGKRTHGPYLIAAIEYGDIDKVSHILSSKFRDKSKVKVFLTTEVRRLASDYVEVPLLLAATLDNPTIIKYFVSKHEANINFVYEYGHSGQRRRKTALLVAVRRGLYVTVDALLQLNADINVQDHKGRTPLHHAVRKADYRMAKLLLARGAQTGAADMGGNAPLHIASIFGHTELCRLLLRHGADLYKKGQHGSLPIHIAAREGHASLVKMMISLFEVSADIRVPCYDEREQAPIHVAAAEGHYETVFTLLDACGSDVNVRDSEGETALHCAALREYDPLGMKSKDDYTETAKVLLNFGAEVNFRNARGETALHLAARNELQKMVEVLVLAGGDPLSEDNDRNKPIDLVVPEDAVSRQTLKTAMADRERIMNDAREVRAKGFTTSLQRELPLSVRSQSTLNIPLAGMQGTMMSSRYMSHTGIYQPPAGMSTMLHNHSGLMQSYGNHSGSRTSSSNDSKRRSDITGSVSIAGPRLPQSMLNVSAGNLIDGVPPAGRQAAAIRKVRSVEELDQPRSKRQGDGRQPQPRGRNSYQASEVSSIWNVTPPGSVHDLAEEDQEPEIAETPTKKSGRFRKVPKKKPALNESDEELEKPGKKKTNKKPPQQQNKSRSGKSAANDGNESEEYYLDDDDGASSADDLDVEVRPAGRKKKHAKPLPAVPETQPSKSDKKTKHGKVKQSKEQAGVHTWLDEQARILKEHNRSEAVNPVAHSTPPTTTKHRRRKDSSSSTSSSSSSSSSSTSSSEASSGPKGPPPPPPTKAKPATKPKPPPPPKPSKETRGRHAHPLVQMENPGMREMIQLDVDETHPEAQTVISIIPVNPPGPTRVEKVPHGGSSSTFVNLQNSRKDVAESPPQKQKKPVPAGRGSNDKPVPRPRESKKPAEQPKPPPPATSKKNVKQQEPLAEDSESSTDFSDEDEETVPTTSGKQAAAATKPTAGSRPSPAKPQKQLSLVFEKAGGADTTQEEMDVVGRVRKPSDNKVVAATSLNASNQSASRRSGHRQRASSTQSDDEESEEETDDSESDDADSSRPTTADLKTVQYSSDGQSSLGFTLVGGNVKGVFVQAIDPKSAAARGGLAAGDHILRVNGQLAVGKTRDEVHHMLHGFDGQLTLIVRHKPNLCQRVAQYNGGAGDSLFVRAHFSVEASKKGELDVSEGDIFDVVDTLPEGCPPGYWRARKVKAVNTRRPSESGPEPLGLIPSRTRADKIVVTQNLAHGKPGANDRGGLFFRSFRRAKSASRNGSRGDEEHDERRTSTGLDVVSYERMTQRIGDARRPVIVLGLFCDTIRTMLVRDSPGLFAVPADEVETPKDETPVDVQPILAVPPTKHCLMILSPPAIEYLQQRTDISPLTVYVSPVSKSVVKAVKSKLAPAYNKNPGYMFEEATRFEKNYAHLFSATVPYTTDDSWFFSIKDAVERLQNQPTWTGLSQNELDATAALEARKFLPSMQTAVTVRAGRSGAPAVRMSRTTDDLPQQAQYTKNPAGPAKNSVAQASRVLNTTAPSALLESAGRAMQPAAAAAAAPKSTAKSRGQSTSSLDKALTTERNQRANFTTPSHETPL